MAGVLALVLPLLVGLGWMASRRDVVAWSKEIASEYRHEEYIQSQRQFQVLKKWTQRGGGH